MAESSYYATPSSLSYGGSILISFISGNVKMIGGQVINISETKLQDIYRTSTIVSQLVDGVVLKVLGGARDDQKVQITNLEYIQALVQCYTDERFVEILADHDSGKMKNRLQEEFLKIGIDVQGLKIIVKNLDEINEQKTRILDRHQYSTVAESSDYANMTSQVFSSYGGSILISFISDNVKMAGIQVINMSETKLRDIYRTSTMVTQLLDGVVLKVLGGARDDQKVQITNPEYIQALVQCYTDERFVEILADHESGKMKNRLQEEFLKIGIDVQRLKIIVENLDKVNEQKARILNRHQYSTVAESSDYATVTSQVFSSYGGSILISFISDNVKMAGGQVINMSGTKLRDIYRTSTMVAQLLGNVVLKVLGGARNDQKIQITNPEYIQAVVQCCTDERFVEMLADHDP